MDQKAVYPYTHDYAKHVGKVEFELYQSSLKENIACKKAIEQTIANNFDGMRLKPESAKTVIAEFGYDRVNWVIANTVQLQDFDGRFSHDNKAWAKSIYIPKDMVAGNDYRNKFAVSSHPAVLDGFLNQSRRAYKELNLWDNTQVNSTKELDFERKIMVLDPTVLNNTHKTRDEQLFYCTGGFGCRPNSSGRKVYGEFLVDGEKTYHYREDFIGEANEELLPQWAVVKMKVKETEFQENSEEKVEKPSICKQLEEKKKDAFAKPNEHNKVKQNKVIRIDVQR